MCGCMFYLYLKWRRKSEIFILIHVEDENQLDEFDFHNYYIAELPFPNFLLS